MQVALAEQLDAVRAHSPRPEPPLVLKDRRKNFHLISGG